MYKNITLPEVAKWLSERDNFLVLTHKHPDGDTLGSAGGLVGGLNELGKTAYLLENAEITPRYEPYVAHYFAPDGFEPSFVIAVDTATTELLPKNSAPYLDEISLCIDHHGTYTGYAELVCCFADYAASGEIIFGILDTLMEKSGRKMSSTVADCLYVAISTDTGCFSYSNTTSNTHAVASKLIELGASAAAINKRLFRTRRRGRITIEGMISSSMEFAFAGKVAIITITRDMMKASSATEDDIDDISSFPSSVEGVEIGITIREMTSPTDCKISVRAIPPHNASQICEKFGGGGHRAAAGATIAKSASEALQDLLAALEGHFQKP